MLEGKLVYIRFDFDLHILISELTAIALLERECDQVGCNSECIIYIV